jgi:hypothetical protein
MECGAERARLDNEHLQQRNGFALQEYATRHQLPLDLILHANQINQTDSPEASAPPLRHLTESARCTTDISNGQSNVRW